MFPMRSLSMGTTVVFYPSWQLYSYHLALRYFLSGSLDGKLRLWSIPDKKVAYWNEVPGTKRPLITAANFCHGGQFAVVGTHDGRCIFYHTEVSHLNGARENKKKPPQRAAYSAAAAGSVFSRRSGQRIQPPLPAAYSAAAAGSVFSRRSG